MRKGHLRPKVMQTKKERINGRPINPKDENKVIGLGKPNEISKNPWECRVSKRAKEAQREQMGQGCPREKTKETQEPISRKTNGHAKPLGERVNGWPKEAHQD